MSWYVIVGAGAVAIVVGCFGIPEVVFMIMGEDESNRVWRLLVLLPSIYGWVKLIEYATMKRLRRMR